jgi:lauroyl/myristoyl acyltransferase
MIGYLFYHLGAFFSRLLPRPLPQWIARLIGEVNYVLRPGTRRVVRENLRAIHAGALTEPALRQRSHAAFINFARAIQIFLELPFMRWEEVAARCDMSAFERALEENGITDSFIVASAHIGPWELGGYCLCRMGFRVHTVALEHPSPWVTRFYTARRARLGVVAYPREGSFYRLKEALDDGACVALLVDRAYGKAKKAFTLFGVEADFPLGHLLLAVRSRVPVLTGALVFDGRDRFRYVHGGAHRIAAGTNEIEGVERVQEACLRDLEGIIRAYSDQWCHFQPLGRTESHGY